MKANKAYFIGMEVIHDLLGHYILDNYEEAVPETPVAYWLVYDENDELIEVTEVTE